MTHPLVHDEGVIGGRALLLSRREKLRRELRVEEGATGSQNALMRQNLGAMNAAIARQSERCGVFAGGSGGIGVRREFGAVRGGEIDAKGTNEANVAKHAVLLHREQTQLIEREGNRKQPFCYPFV